MILLLLACFLTPPTLDSPVESPSTADPLTVAILRGEPAEGQSASLSVVAQSGLLADGSSFYVSDLEPGPRSGLRVWSDEGFAFHPTPGDRIGLGGTYTLVDGQETLVVGGGDLTLIGSGEPVEPMVPGQDWNELESGLVRFSGVSATWLDGAGIAELDVGARLDPGFFKPDVRCRRSWGEVVGILASTPTGWALRPRNAEDLMGVVEPEVLSSTLAEVQAGVCGPVSIEGVSVTPTATDVGGITYVLADGQAGLQVEAEAAVTEAHVEVPVGVVVQVTGEAGESGAHTRLIAETWTTGGPEATTAMTLSGTPEDWAIHDGILVELTAVTVTGPLVGGQAETDRGVVIDGLFYTPILHEAEVYSSVTGVILEREGRWAIAPRSAADLRRALR